MPLLYGARFRPLRKVFLAFKHVRVNSKYVLVVLRTCVQFTYVRKPTYKYRREILSFYVNIEHVLQVTSTYSKVN